MKEDVVDRLKVLLKAKGISRPRLAAMTGVDAERWASVVNRRVNVRVDEILALGELWPAHRHWLFFGDELPESGQISPMTQQLAYSHLSEALSAKGAEGFYIDTILKNVKSLHWGEDLITSQNEFERRIKILNEVIKSEALKDIYFTDRDCREKKLSRLQSRISKNSRSKSVRREDVIAIEWLEFIASKIDLEAWKGF